MDVLFLKMVIRAHLKNTVRMRIMRQPRYEAQEVGDMILVTREDATELLQPGKQSLNFPAPAIAAQRAAVLGRGLAAVGPMRSDQLDAFLECSTLAHGLPRLRYGDRRR